MKIIKKSNLLYAMSFLILMSLILSFLSVTTVNAAFKEYEHINEGGQAPPSLVPVNVNSAIISTHNDGSSTISRASANIAFKNESDVSNLFNALFNKGHVIISGISGVVALTLILLVIKQFTELGYHAGNPQERAKTLTGLLWTFIAIGISGSVSIFMGLFYNIM